MKTLNKNTKFAQELILNYMNSTKYGLYNCYTKPSKKKRLEYERCLEIMKEMNGKDKRIPTHNIYYFTFAFKTENQLVYITKNNIYIITID